MTSHSSNDSEQDDETLRELLKPLREIEAPEALLGECLQVIATSPRAFDAVSQRSLSISVSLTTIVASLLVGAVLGWTLRGSTKVTNVTVAPQSNEVQTDVPESEVPGVAVKPSYYANEIYLCGVGRIYSSSGYQIWENTDEK